MTEAAPGRWAILLPFAAVTLIWGSTWFVIRDQIAHVPATWSVTYRFLLAGLVMGALALVRRERFPRDARGLAFAGLVGVAQFSGNFNAVYRAEEHITSGLVAVVFALLLLPNALLGRVVLGQRLSPRLLAGSAAAVAGIGLLILRQARADPSGPGETLVGLAYTAAAILAASIANVAQGTQTAKRYAMIPTLSVAMLIGAAIDAVVAWKQHGGPVFDWRPSYLAGLAYLAVFASALAFPLYYRVLRAIGTAKAAYSSVIVPVVAMALSTFFEGYRWSPLAVAGAGLTALGLAVALSTPRESAASPAR